MTWAAEWLPDLDEAHVTPDDDLIDHQIEDCPCDPTTEPVPRPDGTIGWLITHHSLDGREAHEPDHQETP